MTIKPLNGQTITPGTVAGIGFFDGLHRAHQVLIETTIAQARSTNRPAAVITFDVHPKSVLLDLDYQYITPIDKKIKLLKAFELDTIYVIEFDKQKASLTPKAFIDTYLHGLSALVCGFDFHFGVRGSGNVETLRAASRFATIVLEPMLHDGFKIGSTHIRDLIAGGHVDSVPETLNRFYSLEGTVIHGEKKGREIGYPTANLDTGSYLIPKKGVYATQTRRGDRWYRSMATIGHNPTLNRNNALSVETYLFDFDDNLYGETIEVRFLKRLRDEQKFPDVAALIAQIDKDAVIALDIIKKHE
ncbi:MAG: bifunctional riboflavin kinase/FAD synthetase [Acholeplasmatales bacterium]|nr:MAG: bifunctional riboflavin kinase/FAD synthetase [Acholeplasmatales bacterium]